MKIQTKITVIYVVLAILIVASLGIFTSIRIESYFKERLVDELSSQADLVLFILQKDSTSSFSKIDEQVKFLGGLEHLRITLIDSQGDVLADSDVPFTDIPIVKNHLDRPEVQTAKLYGVGHDIRHSTTVNHDFLYMAKLVKNSPKSKDFSKLQYIRLSIPLEEVKTQVNRIRSIVVIVGLSVLLVIIVVSMMVSSRIARPMIHIARVVEQIRTGDLDAKLAIASNDEIGLVAKAINELVDKLKADIVQLKKLELVRSQFLGNVSHELRTPIFAVQGYIETLHSGAVDDPSVNRSFLEKAQDNLDRLNTLLEDLINISQIESGEMKMSFRIFRVNEFLQSVGKEVESRAATRNISFRLSLKTNDNDEVFGDKDRLRQVLDNLISNAINYNRSDSDVILSSEKTPQGVRLCVKDTGIGIPPEYLPRIFERFYRVDSDRSRALGGTGLGLAIVKHILEAHGSSVEVESKVGEGSTFCFTLKSS
jgi:two-component system phosphate regulon sensor histidine kinase PhoR